MKAIVIKQPGGPEVLQTAERPVPEPASNEVLIKVVAAGVNRPDVFQRKGNYPPPPGAPQDIPGLEVSGYVEKAGEDVASFKTGDAVCALVAGGGYAEYVLADAGSCLPIPKGMDITQAAALPETIFTVWHNVFQRGRLQAGETLLIHGGSSGIGTTAIQLGKAFGAKVIVTVGSEEKVQLCLKLGADIAINYKNQDFAAILKNEGIDVILDMVGGDYIAKNINILRPDGRLVFINLMKGSKPTDVDFGKIMAKRLTITGSTLRNRDLGFKRALAEEIHRHVWPIIESGRFSPIINRTFPLADATEAHRFMESGDSTGKLILLT